MKKSAALVLLALGLVYFAAEAQSASLGKGSPQFRAIGGVSMGAYGAMNIG